MNVCILTGPKTFTFNGHTLRTVVFDGKPWFVATDVCRAVGIVNTTNAVRPLDDDEKTRVDRGFIHGTTLQTLKGPVPKINLVTEGGLYKIILRAQRSNPAAREFQDWLTKEVLPRIRRDGA